MDRRVETNARCRKRANDSRDIRFGRHAFRFGNGPFLDDGDRFIVDIEQWIGVRVGEHLICHVDGFLHNCFCSYLLVSTIHMYFFFVFKVYVRRHTSRRRYHILVPHLAGVKNSYFFFVDDSMNTVPAVERLKRVPQFEQRTPEWYEARRHLITASVAASALGIKPFDSFTGCPRKNAIENTVYRTFKGNVATQWGCDHEDMVRERFDRIMGTDTTEYGLIRHNDVHGLDRGFSWIGASPDGITECGAMVEIKCPYRRRITPGVVPHHYLPQVQVQLEVCDLNICYFVQWQPAHLNIDGVEIFDITPVQRDRGWFEKHKETLYSFYLELQDARASYVEPPPPSCLIRDDLYADVSTTSSVSPLFLDDDEVVCRPSFLDDD